MKRYFSYKDYLLGKYSKAVYKVGVDAGFSCPNRDESGRGGCTFCDPSGAIAQYLRDSESVFNRKSSYNKEVSSLLLRREKSIDDQIDKGIDFLKKRYKAEAFSLYFQSFTNTFDKVENLEKIYKAALSKAPFLEFIVSTRPDCLEDEKIELLKSFKSENREVWVELGLQSANDNTLKLINRGHSKKEYIDASKRVKDKDLKLCTHIILSLPGETDEDFIKTAKLINDCGSDALKIHNLNITGSSVLENDYLEGEVVSGGFERHLEKVVLILRHLRKDIIIERFICETPAHRLVAPRSFPDKFIFLSSLDEMMERLNIKQGDLYNG